MFHIRTAIRALLLCASSLTHAREAKLVRHPGYHQGRIAFTYLGGIWTELDLP
jgi:hypothetical protein